MAKIRDGDAKVKNNPTILEEVLSFIKMFIFGVGLIQTYTMIVFIIRNI